MRAQLGVLLLAGLLAGCAPGSASSLAPEATAAPTSASPEATASAGTEGPGACSLARGCGHAVIRPPAATVGALVRIEADNGYFGLMGAWVPGCPVPSIAFHPIPYGPIGSELPGPNGLYSGVRATLAIPDASAATFLVPSIPVGTYRTALSCGSADEAFAQPELPDDFRVLP